MENFHFISGGTIDVQMRTDYIGCIKIFTERRVCKMKIVECKNMKK